MIEFKHLQHAMAEYARAIEDRYKTNLANSGRRASGDLISSVNTKVIVNDNEYSIELQLADYWKYVEDGTRPHFPPVSKILEWVKVKRILPTPMANGKLPTEKQLAYLIGRKIANEGFEGTNDLEHTLNEVDYEQIIAEAFNMDVMEYINEILLILQ